MLAFQRRPGATNAPRAAMPRAPAAPSSPFPLPARLRLGISSCLLGENVRWDGNARGDPYILGTLTRHFDFVPVCPELAIGLSVPREPVRLVGPPEARRVLGVNDPALDVTDALASYGKRMAGEVRDISGYILKARSPSCGMEEVAVYRLRGGRPAKQGRGMYAQTFMAARPELPVEEEGRLGDPMLRENFIVRVFALGRWQAMAAQGLTPRRLLAFHTAHRLTLLAHGDAPYRALDRLVAQAGSRSIGVLARTYLLAFMEALRGKATRKVHTNVLTHLAGCLKRKLEPGDQAELDDSIRAYRVGEVPLIVPITLFRHHFRRHPHPAAAGQIYLEPHPSELALGSGM